MIILPGANGLYIIKSYKDGNNLSVLPTGRCQFSTQDEGSTETFDIETNLKHFFFVFPGHHGRVLLSHPNGVADVNNKNRQQWEEMTVDPIDVSDEVSAKIFSPKIVSTLPLGLEKTFFDQHSRPSLFICRADTMEAVPLFRADTKVIVKQDLARIEIEQHYANFEQTSI